MHIYGRIFIFIFLLQDRKCLAVILKVVVYEGCENQRLNEIMMKFRSEVTSVTYVGRNSTVSTGHQGPAKESASL